MEIPGEDLAGVYSATEFVGWYNGHPDFQDRAFDLARAERVAVVGNGNVAMDVTRILAADPDELASTDITDTALAELRRSEVREIALLGRRGPAQAAFSVKEIKEIGELETADLIVDPADVELDPVSARWLAEDATPAARKNVEYLKEASVRTARGVGRRILCRFLVSPVELLGEGGRLRAIRIEHNRLEADRNGTPRPRGTGHFQELPVDLVFKAVGYRGIPIAGVPFDERKGTIANQDGRVVGANGAAPIAGLYCVGWAKRGPSGLIGTNSADSEATVALLLEDISGATASIEDARARQPEAIVELLRARGIDYATFDDWRRLDQDEVARGEAKGKIRDKHVDIASMMEAIRRSRSPRSPW
jgi:ferredoxin--NADP+ reductase